MSNPITFDLALKKAIEDYLETVDLPDIQFEAKLGSKGTTLTVKFGCFGLDPDSDQAELALSRKPGAPIQEIEIAQLVYQAMTQFLTNALAVKLRLHELTATAREKPKIHLP